MAPKRRTRAEEVATAAATGVAAAPLASGGDRVRAQLARALPFVTQFARSTLQSASDAVPDVLALFASKPATRKSARPVSVTVSFVQAPAPQRIPALVKLPHPVHHRQSICVITPAPSSKFTAELIDDDNAPENVEKIIDDVTLTAKYTDPVQRRGLAKSFDVFFIHSDLKQYPALLSGEFLDWRQPVWMDRGTTPAASLGEAKKVAGKKASFVERLNATMNTVVLPLRGFDTVSVAVGNAAALTDEELIANAVALVDELVTKHLPHGWCDVLTIRLEATKEPGKTISLPVYAHNFEESLARATAAAKSNDVVAAGEPPSLTPPAVPSAAAPKPGAKSTPATRAPTPKKSVATASTVASQGSSQGATSSAADAERKEETPAAKRRRKT